jgi:hypothetical protein
MSQDVGQGRNLVSLARALGGDCYAGGRRALVPAPGHGPTDRSVSLVLAQGRVVAHSFGAADWREVLDDLRARGFIDAQNRLGGSAGYPTQTASAAEPTRAERVRAAAALWASGFAMGGHSAADRYCAARGVVGSTGGLALRARASTPTSVYRDRGARLPALLARVDAPEGTLTAVEVTYLDGRGRRSRLARPPRKLVGAMPAGSAVRLCPAGEEMLVAEGVFTTLSAMRRFELPGWALLSTTNLRRWRAPPGVRRVLIAADRGPDGERSAAQLCAALVEHGRIAEVVLPPEGAGDWNDLDRRE